MLNAKYWENELIRIRRAADVFAVSNGIPCSCNCISCEDCDFNLGKCEEESIKWLYSEHEELEIDWSKDINWERVPADTPVLVRNLNYGEEWIQRKFAVYLPKAKYKYITFREGKKQNNADSVSCWEYCKLTNERDIEKYRRKGNAEH